MSTTFSLKRLYGATKFSCQGIAATWKTEAAFREEIIIGIILFPCAFLLGESLTQTALLILPLFLVLIAELINTGIEHVVNRISLEHHELSGLAKDAGSAAVFVCNILTVTIWGLVALDRFF